MKKIKFYLSIIISLIFVFACTNPNQGTEQKITDDYNLLTVDQLGGVFEIGNNTGNIRTVGQIKNMAHLLTEGTITASQENIYSVEAIATKPRLLIYHRQTKSTDSIDLQIPNSVQLKDPGIIASTFNGNELIAVAGENYIDDYTKHLISINIQDFTVTDLAISFNAKSYITSIQQIDHKLYIATSMDGLFKADLDNKTITPLQFNQNKLLGVRLTIIDNNRLAFMEDIPNTGGFKPLEINLSNQSVIDRSQGNYYGIINKWGSSIYHNGTYLNITPIDAIFKSEYAILKCNFETNKNEIVKIKSPIGSSIIIDIVNN